MSDLEQARFWKHEEVTSNRDRVCHSCPRAIPARALHVRTFVGMDRNGSYRYREHLECRDLASGLRDDDGSQPLCGLIETANDELAPMTDAQALRFEALGNEPWWGLWTRDATSKPAWRGMWP